jgi:SagB-type dehydrogenase family enzyme
MNRVRSGWMVGLFFGMGLCACDSKPRGKASEEVRELNEIPMAQLRVMLKGYPGDWRSASEVGSGKKEPALQKEAPQEAKRITLQAPGLSSLGAMPVREAIAARRSARQFSEAPISLEELGYLLWATQGVTGTEKDDDGRILRQHRAAPSAGGRYPLETYLSIQRVEGIPKGLYRYLPAEHELLVVREDEGLLAELGAACYESPSAKGAAAIFIWSATPYRTEWKYAYLAHRMIAMEAGHVCENLYLAAESCRIGVCALLSYHQPRVDQLLGLDGRDEFAIYLACVGKAAAGDQ